MRKLGAICSGVCNFALIRIFGISQTPSLVSIPKILTNTKPTPPLLRLLWLSHESKNIVIARKSVVFSWQYDFRY